MLSDTKKLSGPDFSHATESTIADGTTLLGHADGFRHVWLDQVEAVDHLDSGMGSES